MAQSTRRPRRRPEGKGRIKKGVVKTYRGYQRYREWGGIGNFLLGEHVCTICRRAVPNWNQTWHQRDHAARMETAAPLPNVVAAQERQEREAQSRAARTAAPARPLPPSRQKSEERARRTQPLTESPPKPHLIQKAIRMATKVTDALRRAWLAWGEHVPETADDAKADFEGLTEATLVAARVVEGKVQALAAIGVDPRVLAKLTQFQEGLAEISLLPAEAYRTMVAVYGPHLADGKDMPAPGAQFFKRGA